MPTTNVPFIQFQPTGVVLPAEGAILAGVLADMNTAFGGGMSQSLSSPQGQLAQSITAIIGDKNNSIAEVINLVNPDTSSGRYQDGIGRIYLMNRIAATGTLVFANCVGLVNTVIPAGAIAVDTSGNQYIALASAVIPASGTVSVQFQCLASGPIACPIGALNQIYKAITGWESISNPIAGVPGTNVESPADFEFRRQNSVAANAVNSIQSVLANVLAVPDVIDAYVTDNSTGATVNTGPTAYPIIANSIYVAVSGGTAAQVAQAIWQKKSLGCAYNGSTTFTYTDTSAGVTPYPTYVVKWVQPAALPIYLWIKIVNSTSLPSNVTQLIQQAVLAAFSGQDGGTRARVASVLYAGRYYAGIAGVDPSVEILSVGIGTSASPTTTSVAVGIDQLPTLAQANILVTLV